MKDKSILIATALDCIRAINDFTDGYTLEMFLEDRKTQDAVVRNLEVIGQALKDYGTDNLSEKSPDIPWSRIAAMRNILAHEYLGIDMVMIWNTVRLHLGQLQNGLNSL